MQTRLIFPCFAFAVSAVTTFGVGRVGHDTLERSSVLLLLALAWGQKPQLAEHLPALYVIRYAVVGCASNLPSKSPRTMAVPNETRICSGKPVWVGHVFSGKHSTEFVGEIIGRTIY